MLSRGYWVEVTRIKLTLKKKKKRRRPPPIWSSEADRVTDRQTDLTTARSDSEECQSIHQVTQISKSTHTSKGKSKEDRQMKTVNP